MLIEDDGRGRCPQYAAVRLDSAAAPGSIVAARITGIADGGLEGRLAA